MLYANLELLERSLGCGVGWGGAEGSVGSPAGRGERKPAKKRLLGASGGKGGGWEGIRPEEGNEDRSSFALRQDLQAPDTLRRRRGEGGDPRLGARVGVR